jgi:hypothetical protein
VRRWLAAAAVLVALAAGGAVAYRRHLPARDPAPTPEQIEVLTAQRKRLQDELRVELDRQDVLDFAQAPAGNVLLGVPTVFAEAMVGQVVSGLLSEVQLELGGLRAHHAGDVSAKILFTQRVGHYDLDVDIRTVRATLRPGTPDLTFGANAIGIRLPVAVAQGRGTGTVRFRWKGQGIAGAVCGDMDVSPDVSSDVRPATYTVTGDFLLGAEGDTVVATPRFRDLPLRIHLQPTELTWASLARTVEEVKGDKNGACRMAIRRIDVRALVEKAIAKGFVVTVPARLIRPLALPARVEQSVEIQGRTVSLGARPLGLAVTPVMIWYGADLSVPR